jgi:ParB/RepB/Spo0J family partition protein
MLIHVNSITIPADRQRKDLGDIAGLINSMETVGQISPIVVEPQGDGFLLIAGERRLTAVKKMKLSYIEAVTMEGLSESERTLVELEENIRRKQLSWQEEIRAIASYHKILNGTVDATAKALGTSMKTLSSQLVVADALEAGKKYEEASSWSACYTIWTIDQGRKLDSAFEDMLLEDTTSVVEEAELTDEELGFGPQVDEEMVAAIKPTIRKVVVTPMKEFVAQTASFLDWAPTYTGKRFNLIHCDFPYGLGMDTANLQNSADRWDTGDGRYADSPELFTDLCRTFFDNQDKFIADSAHCIFWLAAKNYGKIASRFAHYGWSVCDVPLIWHKSDNAGIAPDVRRWPRRTFEMAIFASRGDRKIVKVKGASYAGPTTKDHHLSEKPRAMLGHFFEMVCDSFTDIFDPTCGSGHALLVAKGFGAKSGLGLDVVEDHVKYANGLLGD